MVPPVELLYIQELHFDTVEAGIKDSPAPGDYRPRRYSLLSSSTSNGAPPSLRKRGHVIDLTGDDPSVFSGIVNTETVYAVEKLEDDDDGPPDYDLEDPSSGR